MLLSNYQYTEIMLGTVLFPILYFIYLYLSNTHVIYWDIIWCTISIFVILLFRYFYINYYILQSQNLSSNTIVNGIY
jgi:hypothetical protein